MKIKISEATRVQLDMLVANLERLQFPSTLPKYSSDWAQGGPIIEREKITIEAHDVDKWDNEGDQEWYAELNDCQGSFGPTPLIAAMKLYVSSCLGDEVDIPDEIA